MTGIVFDIKEFAVNDGPGIRVTVFLKGCPLRCKWCHNPEGMDKVPQRNLKTGRMVGEEWTAERLCGYLMMFKEAYDISNGGVTFSGGEPTAQSEFLIKCADRLHDVGISVNLDTSGYCESAVFEKILLHIDWCYYDLKCMDGKLHKDVTGVDNKLILDNLKRLSESEVKYHVRVPLIPKVSDTPANRAATEAFVHSLSRPPEKVDWLPFNVLAPAKYPVYGMEYRFGE